MLFSDAFCTGSIGDGPPPVSGPTVAEVPLAAQDVQSLLYLLHTTNPGGDSVGIPDIPSGSTTVIPSNVFAKFRSDFNDYDDDDGDLSPLAIYTEPRINIPLNNDDLHVMSRMLSPSDAGTDSFDDDESDEGDLLEAKDIVRHFSTFLERKRHQISVSILHIQVSLFLISATLEQCLRWRRTYVVARRAGRRQVQRLQVCFMVLLEGQESIPSSPRPNHPSSQEEGCPVSSARYALAPASGADALSAHHASKERKVAPVEMVSDDVGDVFLLAGRNGRETDFI